MKVAIIIASYDSGKENLMLDKTLEAIKRTNSVEAEIIIIKSTESRAVNINKGIKQALDNGADYICLCDDDVTDFSDQWLFKLIQHFSDKKIGVVGPALLSKNPPIMFSAEIGFDKLNFWAIGHGMMHKDHMYTKIVKGVISCLCVFRKEVFEEIGLYDETFKGSQWDDLDLVYRIYHNTKWKTLYDGSIWCIHDTQRRNADINWDFNKEHFRTKWQNLES